MTYVLGLQVKQDAIAHPTTDIHLLLVGEPRLWVKWDSPEDRCMHNSGTVFRQVQGASLAISCSDLIGGEICSECPFRKGSGRLRPVMNETEATRVLQVSTKCELPPSATLYSAGVGGYQFVSH